MPLLIPFVNQFLFEKLLQTSNKFFGKTLRSFLIVSKLNEDIFQQAQYIINQIIAS